MSSSGDLPPIAFQQSIIASNLHSTLLSIFLFGIYLGAYTGSLYVYTVKNTSHKLAKFAVISVIAVLFILVAAETCLQWYEITTGVLLKGKTRLDTYHLSLGDPNPIRAMLSTLLLDLACILADGLMIWRCFCVTGKSLRRIIAPLLFFFAEIALSVVETVLNNLQEFMPAFETNEQIRVFNIIDGTLSGVSAATSLLTTFMIAHIIYSSTSHNPRARKRYRHIIEITVQSSLVYSVAILGLCICGFINTGNQYVNWTVLIAEQYFAGITAVITGLAPTLMVARLAVGSDRITQTFAIDSNTSMEFPSHFDAPSTQNFSDESGLHRHPDVHIQSIDVSTSIKSTV